MDKLLGLSQTLKAKAQYHASAAPIYAKLCGKKAHTLLLESAEINSKKDLKSIMLIDAALSLRCMGNQVWLSALSENGEQLIPFLFALFSEFDPQSTPQGFSLSIPAAPKNLDEDSRLKAPSVLTVLRKVQQSIQSDNLLPESIFLAGVFAFDLMASVEPLTLVKEGENNCPDYLYYLSETLLVLDHKTQSAELIGAVFSGKQHKNILAKKTKHLAALAERLSKPFAALPQQHSAEAKIETNVSDSDFCKKVNGLKQHILAGDIFQVVPSRCFSLPCPSPLSAYGRLRVLNPSPYMFYMQSDDFVLFGASPESALKYDSQSNQVEIYPIAGTRIRGKKADGSIDLDLDGRIELGLRQDHKELAEHMMLVDLARNDIARISQPGSRHVAELLKVDRYSHVMHLVSRVVGLLKEDLDALHAYQACMNMGTLTGAPKIRAANLLRKAEGIRRGSYGGAVGYLNARGDMDTCIVIRSALVTKGIAHIQAGAGVVYDSNPQSEADETRSKAMAVLSAIGAQL